MSPDKGFRNDFEDFVARVGVRGEVRFQHVPAQGGDLIYDGYPYNKLEIKVWIGALRLAVRLD